MTNCNTCNYEVALNYCPNCGQAAHLKRIDRHYISHEIEHVLHFERGILYTIRELLIKPGENVRHFISINRSRLVKPIIFIIITSLIYSLITHFFHIDDEYVYYTETKKSTTGAIFDWVKGHYGYANIIMGVFIAFWAKIFFRKYNYNFFEILILLCFVMGMSMLIFAGFALIQGISHIKIMQFGAYLIIIYCAWAIGQFFDGKKGANYFKALGAYLLGMITFTILALAAGSVIDLMIKQLV